MKIFRDSLALISLFIFSVPAIVLLIPSIGYSWRAFCWWVDKITGGGEIDGDLET